MSLRSTWYWSLTWNFPLNQSKCCHLPIGKPPTTPLIFADGITVTMVETAKDPRVAIDTFFKPSSQCREEFSRARAVFFMMCRGFAELTLAIFRSLYLAMVNSNSTMQSKQWCRISKKI